MSGSDRIVFYAEWPPEISGGRFDVRRSDVREALVLSIESAINCRRHWWDESAIAFLVERRNGTKLAKVLKSFKLVPITDPKAAIATERRRNKLPKG